MEDLLQVEAPNSQESKYQPTIQSANTLFHFVSKFEYLVQIIDKMAIIPRYCTENIEYLNIETKKIAYPMLCFCDINLHKIQEHMDFYGKYGIAFSKEWGIKKGIQPIQYVNQNSVLRHDFTTAFQAAMHDTTECAAQDYLQTHMYYLKPIQGTMPREGKEIPKNFTDECEWRYIPDVAKIDLPQAITQDNLFSRSTLNDALENCNSCWLQFNIEEIKYIILQTREEFNQVIPLLEKKKLSNEGKNWLISKILVWQEVWGDF